MTLACVSAIGPAWRVAFTGDATLDLHDIGDINPLDPAALVADLKAACDKSGTNSRHAVVALPTSWCSWGTLPAEEDPGSHRARMFRLEEQLPVSAEEIVADFICGRRLVFGCAARKDRLAPLLTAFRAGGWSQVLAVPASLAIAQELVRSSLEAPDIAIVPSDIGVDLVVLDGGFPAAWWTLTDDPAAIEERLAALSAEAQRPLVVVSAVGTRTAAVRTADIIPDATLVRFAAAALAKKPRAWLNFNAERRRGLAALNRSSKAALLSSLLVCSLSITVANVIATERYTDAERACVRRQIVLFTSVAKGQPVPPSPAARLRSMAQDLRTNQPPRDLNTLPSLSLLYATLSRLPAQPLHILEIRGADGTLTLDGRTRTHAQAETLAGAIRQGKAPALSVSPPKSSSVPGGEVAFSFTVSALPPESAP